MEFWGVEIKPGQTLKLEPGENKYLHLSQASLGEIKDNVKENVLIYLKVNDQKLVLATLSADNCAQIQSDLIFEKEFELSHSSKNANVYLSGYKTVAVDNELSDFDDRDLESDEDIRLQKANGEPIVKVGQAKPAARKPSMLNTDVSAAKAKPKAEKQKGGKQKENEDNDDDESDDDDDDKESDEDESDDEDMAEAEDDSEDKDEGNSDEEDEATVKNSKPSNKRKADSSLKTPVPEKKAKMASGMGEGQKKGGVGKKDDSSGKKNDKAKQQTTKLVGSVTCKSCSKTFNSDDALQDHTKAKHSASK